MADERQREFDEQDSDLGLGTVAPSQIRRRILEKNGNFNVIRRGLSFWSSASIYHHLLNMSWSGFLGWAALAYLGLNLFFAAIYVVLDVHVGALAGGDSIEGVHRFLRAFYFSVETSSTIGYERARQRQWMRLCKRSIDPRLAVAWGSRTIVTTRPTRKPSSSRTANASTCD